MENSETVQAELIKDPSLASIMDLMTKNQTQENYKNQYESLSDEFDKLKNTFKKLKSINEEILLLYEELREDYEDLLEDYEDLQDTNNIKSNNQNNNV